LRPCRDRTDLAGEAIDLLLPTRLDEEPDFRQRLLDGAAGWTDPEVVRVFGLWRQLLEDGAFNPHPNGSDWLDAAKLVHTRGAAMLLMGTWVMDPLQAMGWQAGRDFGWFPFPVIDAQAQHTTLTVVDGLVLGAGAADRMAVHAVLDHLATPAVQAALAQASGNFAPHCDVVIAATDPLRRRIRDDAQGRLAFAYDLATPPEAERIGLAAFAEFLDAPQDADRILAETQRRMRACFAQPAMP
jgi:ABC-type glycerol-3-phosphate transport system substrate-binding protein